MKTPASNEICTWRVRMASPMATSGGSKVEKFASVTSMVVRRLWLAGCGGVPHRADTTVRPRTPFTALNTLTH